MLWLVCKDVFFSGKKIFMKSKRKTYYKKKNLPLHGFVVLDRRLQTFQPWADYKLLSFHQIIRNDLVQNVPSISYLDPKDSFQVFLYCKLKNNDIY